MVKFLNTTLLPLTIFGGGLKTETGNNIWGSPLLEVPPPNKEPPEVTRQYPVRGTGNPNIPQDPFDTQMEVPFSEDTVEPVFNKPEMTDFEIPPVLEEMIPDGSLIHKHLPKQADICDAAQVWGGPRATEHTKECLLLRRPGC